LIAGTLAGAAAAMVGVAPVILAMVAAMSAAASFSHLPASAATTITVEVFPSAAMVNGVSADNAAEPRPPTPSSEKRQDK